MILCTKDRLIRAALCLGLTPAGCESVRVPATAPQISLSDAIVLHPIAAGVWVHTTFFDLPGMGRVPANGLALIDGKEAMLEDSNARY